MPSWMSYFGDLFRRPAVFPTGPWKISSTTEHQSAFPPESTTAPLRPENDLKHAVAENWKSLACEQWQMVRRSVSSQLAYPAVVVSPIGTERLELYGCSLDARKFGCQNSCVKPIKEI